MQTNPAIGHPRPRFDLRREIVEDEIAAPGAYEKHQMMLSRIEDDLAQQQDSGRPAPLEQLVALAHRVIVAIAPIGVDDPLLACNAQFVANGHDREVDCTVNLLQIHPAFLSQPDRPAAE
ncbi:hypothetical protein UB31_26715 [Bradyrhizobium sp. LTSP849]|nr:hypothetical protein UB31_26715 [Bradyrhizobium sp. LTSP849]